VLPDVQGFLQGGTIVGKNKNRGERTGQRHERHATATMPDDDMARTSAASEQTMPVPGAEQHVSHKRGKKFGHN
jgi:hypothetical protein